MTSLVDVLDSAVKIGLGAVISGVATYIMARVGARHELAKSKQALLERISLATQESAGAISKAMMIVQRLDKTPEEKRSTAMVKIQDIFQKTIDEHNTAEGLAALVGHAELTRGLKMYEDAALQLLDLIRVEPINYEAQRPVIDSINSARIVISAAINSAYVQAAS
jgi:hypothetical protein